MMPPVHTIRKIVPIADDFSCVATSPDYSPSSLFFYFWNKGLPKNLEGERAQISEREGKIFIYQEMNCLNGDIYAAKVNRVKAASNFRRYIGEISEAQKSMLNDWINHRGSLDSSFSSNNPTNSA